MNAPTPLLSPFPQRTYSVKTGTLLMDPCLVFVHVTHFIKQGSIKKVLVLTLSVRCGKGDNKGVGAFTAPPSKDPISVRYGKGVWGGGVYVTCFIKQKSINKVPVLTLYVCCGKGDNKGVGAFTAPPKIHQQGTRLTLYVVGRGWGSSTTPGSLM